MYHREHQPPHFHAFYGGKEISVDIGSGAITGNMPPRAVALILEWLKLHRAELRDNWLRAQQLQTLRPIEPLY